MPFPRGYLRGVSRLGRTHAWEKEGISPRRLGEHGGFEYASQTGPSPCPPCLRGESLGMPAARSISDETCFLRNEPNFSEGRDEKKKIHHGDTENTEVFEYASRTGL